MIWNAPGAGRCGPAHTLTPSTSLTGGRVMETRAWSPQRKTQAPGRCPQPPATLVGGDLSQALAGCRRSRACGLARSYTVLARRCSLRPSRRLRGALFRPQKLGAAGPAGRGRPGGRRHPRLSRGPTGGAGRGARCVLPRRTPAASRARPGSRGPPGARGQEQGSRRRPEGSRSLPGGQRGSPGARGSRLGSARRPGARGRRTYSGR